MTKQEEIQERIFSKKVAIEICQHIPEKVEQLKGEIAELESQLIEEEKCSPEIME